MAAYRVNACRLEADCDNEQRTYLAAHGKDESIRYLLQYIDRDLPKQQTLETWIDLLTQLRTTYSATNYIHTHAVYTNDWGGAALLIQNAKKRAYKEKIVIRKVFLIEDDNEIPMVSGVLEEQKNIGVQIHYLPFRCGGKALPRI